MKVKSFSVGLANGVCDSIKALDKYVLELGDVQIHQLTDTFYPSIAEMIGIGGNPFSPHIVRVVLYD